MNDCSLPIEALAEFLSGANEPGQTGGIAEHLILGCGQCEERLAFLRRFTPAIQAAVTTAAPCASERALSRAFAIASQHPGRRGLGLVEVARMLLDGRPRMATAPSGFRGQLHEAFQLVFETGDRYVELWQERVRPGHWCLIGTVLDKVDSAAVPVTSVDLVSGAGSTLPVSTATSEFHVASAPAGVYSLSLQLGTNEILIPDLRVGA